MLLLREHGRHGWRDAAESQPVLPNELVERLDDLVPDPEVDVKADERAAVETCIHRKPGATLGSLIERHHRPADDEREEVRQANLCGRAQVIEQRFGAWGVRQRTNASTDAEVEVARRSRLVEPHFQRIAALEYPAVTGRQRWIEHPREESVKCHLPAQPLQVTDFALGAIEQADFESVSERAGRRVGTRSCRHAGTCLITRSSRCRARRLVFTCASCCAITSPR